MKDQQTSRQRIIVLSATDAGTRGMFLEVGESYIMQPRNAAPHRHRDRHCVILDFVPHSEAYPFMMFAKVRFTDDGRIARVVLEDLADVDADRPWPR